MSLTNTDILKSNMIEALEKSLGIVTTACKAVGISRQTHYEWCKTDADYNAKVEGISDIALDFAESQLHKQIQSGEVSSTIFYLKTKGKKRGYIEKTETEQTGQMVIKVVRADRRDNDNTTETTS